MKLTFHTVEQQLIKVKILLFQLLLQFIESNLWKLRQSQKRSDNRNIRIFSKT